MGCLENDGGSPEILTIPPAVRHIVTIPYADLLKEDFDLSLELEAGFGPNSLGIVAVSGVPKYSELRSRLLPLASRMAALSEESKMSLVDPASRFSFGWSHGNEMLRSGQPDVYKGSFYANPIVDVPTTDEALIERYPSYCRQNIWPREDLPELEPAFKELGRLMLDVGLLLAHHCSKFVSARKPDYEEGKLVRMLKSSKCHKGRLLHYFPASNRDTEEWEKGLASWCGWHFDHGSLTGLTRATYMKGKDQVPNPDPQSGLYIRDRLGTITKAVFAEDDIAYQMGEATEFHSGGLFRATLHCVQAARGEAAVGVDRNTFALFMQPQWDEPLILPEGHCDRTEVTICTPQKSFFFLISAF
uniref:Non-haem dioxygenase N-terminal domain-containing protein n=1 Tax=Physcomitrium patens TaxID=3218 RepID=A0A7I4ECC9_PHYPA